MLLLIFTVVQTKLGLQIFYLNTYNFYFQQSYKPSCGCKYIIYNFIIFNSHTNQTGDTNVLMTTLKNGALRYPATLVSTNVLLKEFY